jgi:hypothetical protein
MNEFSSMTDLGRMFGATSHVMGRWLIEIGLRTDDKKPSREAFAAGYVEQAPTGRGNGGYFWVWNTEKTITALEKAGHRRADQHAAPAPTQSISRLVPPFSPHRSSENGFELPGGDGAVAIWVWGEDNARLVAAALNRFFGEGPN